MEDSSDSEGHTSSFALVGKSVGKRAANLRGLSAKLRDDIKHLKTQLTEKSKIIETMKTEHADEKEKWQREETSLTGECIDLKYKLQCQQIELNKHKERILSLEGEVHQLEQQLLEHDQNNATMKDEDKIGELEKKISNIIFQVDGLKNLMEQYNHSESDTKSVADATKQTVDDLRGLAVAAEIHRKEVNTELKTLRSKMDTVSKENGEIKSMIDTVSQENNEMKSQMSRLHGDVKTMNANVEKILRKKEKSNLAKKSLRKVSSKTRLVKPTEE